MIELGLLIAILVRCYQIGIDHDMGDKGSNFDAGLAAVEGYGPTDGDMK